MDVLRPLLRALTCATTREDVGVALTRLCDLPGVVGFDVRHGDDTFVRIGTDDGHCRSTAVADRVVTVVTDGTKLPFDLEELADIVAGVSVRVAAAEHTVTRAGLFDALAGRVADGVILATPDGEVPVYNAALERLTGWSHEEVRTHGWTNLVYADPADRAEAQQAIAALVRGVPSDGVMRDLRRSDGTSFRARIWSSLVPREGQAPMLLGVIRSVAAARTQVEAKPDRIASRLAHEFSNLLAAISGHADLIEHLAADEEVRRHAETIADSADRGGRMARSVLAHDEAAAIQTRPVDVGGVVTSVLDLTRATWPDGVELVVDLAADLPLGEVDAGALQQALLNLIGNALAVVGGSGRIEVEVALRSPSDSVCFSAGDPDHPMIAIRVRDDGPGFSTEALDHLFTPMYTERADGHGLGLAAVRGIVAAHDGAIDVFNDGGAVVELFVPVNRRPEATRQDLAGSDEVWVVDPADQVLEFARVSLAGAGFQVEGHASVADVLEETVDHPDILVVASEARPALTSWLEQRPHVRVVWVGEDLLQRPFTGRALVAAVQAVGVGRAP